MDGEYFPYRRKTPRRRLEAKEKTSKYPNPALCVNQLKGDVRWECYLLFAFDGGHIPTFLCVLCEHILCSTQATSVVDPDSDPVDPDS